MLENPGHAYTSQPYYFVRLQNLTKGITVYQDFNSSGQPGVPWKDFTDSYGNDAFYTDWQLVDIAPGNAQLAVNDQVELEVIAAGCAGGAHWGRLYVDAVGSGIPGLYSWATGAQQANAGTDVVYTINYKNGGTTTTTGTKLDLVTPPDTTYKSTTGSSCTAPGVGSTGTVSCSLGSLAPGSTGSYTITVTIPSATASGTVITNGNYSIYATGVSALVGPNAQTTVTNGTSYANLGVTKTDGVAAVGWGASDTYTIVVSNAGPNATGATLTDSMPAQLTGVTWTCAGTGGATCSASGSGDINDTLAMPVGSTATYTVSATVVAGSGTGSIVNTAMVATTGGQTDPDTTDNSAVDNDTVGTLDTLTVTKLGSPAVGTITSTPAAINCGAMCTSASASFIDGNQVILTAAPQSGATFVGWGGACSGTTTTCTLTMSAGLNVSATFAGTAAATTVASGGPQSTTISTVFASPLTVQVSDSNGTPVPGVTVTFAAPTTGARATLGTTTATTDALGQASTTATANATAGTYNVTATVAGVTPAASFALSNIGSPASIAMSSGSPQSMTVGGAFTNLVAIVKDSANQPVPNITVTFAAPSTGARAVLGSPTATTDANGLATMTANAGTIAGAYTVTASYSSLSTGFSLTNTAGAATSLAAQTNAQAAIVTTAFATQLAVKATDAYGNAVSGVSISYAAPGSGASATFSAASATTNASGIAQVTATANTVAGSYSVTGSATGLGSVSFTMANTAGAPATIAQVSGSGQSATVHTSYAASLAVLVSDVYGNPVPSAVVTYLAPGTGASATVSNVSTDSTGQAASAAFANNIAGTFTVAAQITSGSLTTFSLHNTAGAPATVSFSGGTGQNATVAAAFATALQALVVDAYGNPVAGVTVSFSSAGAGAGISPNPITFTTNASGIASGTLTANHTAGSYTVSGAVTGATSATTTFTNTAGVATALASTSGSGQHATVASSFASPLVATATDTYGNLVPSAQVTFTSSNATFTPNPATTGSNGQASASVLAGQTATTYTVTATIPGASTTFSLTNDPGAPAAIAIVTGNSQSATVATAFTNALAVHVTDSFNNDVPNATVNYAAQTTAGATAVLGAASAATGSTGRATMTATAGHVTGSYTVTATVGSVAPASFSLTNTAGAVATLSTTGGAGQQATVLAAFAAPLAVHAADQYNNAVPHASITFTAPGSGASATFADAGQETTDTSGNAQIVATAASISGSYSVQVTSGTAPAIAIALTNLPGPPAAIAVLDGSAQQAVVTHAFGAPMRATVRDAEGNTVPNAIVRFTGATTGASAQPSSTLATTDANGIAQVTATAGSVSGANDLTASVANVSAPFHLTNNADVPASISISPTASPQWMTVAQPYAQPLSLTVYDRFGNPAPQAHVTYSRPVLGATATLSAATIDTDANGHASVAATAAAVTGAYIIHAAVSGITNPASFTLTNTADAPATLTIASGDAQSATVDTDFASDVAVTVQDSLGNAVPNAVVTFTPPMSRATAALASGSAISNASGVATMHAHASTATGSYQLVASLVGTQAPIAFAMTNTAGAPAAIVASPAATPQAAHVDGQFQQPLNAYVTDSFGNPVPNATITYSTPAGGPTGTMSSSATTDASGNGNAVITAGTVAGSYVITASVTGLAQTTTFSMLNLAGDAQAVTISAGNQQQTIAAGTFAAPLVALVSDIHGNPVPSVALTFAAPTAAGSLATLSTSTDTNGIASTTMTAGTRAGSYAVVASTPDGAAPASFAVTVLAGAPATATATASAATQSAEVLHAYAQPLAMHVVDTYGNDVPNAQIELSTAASPGATLSDSTALTDRFGMASVLAIADATAGSFTVSAAVDGTSGTSFAMTNLSSSPNHVVITGGGAQHAMATATFGAAVALRVVDAYGNPVANVPLAVATTGALAAVSNASPVSDSNGNAQVMLVAGITPGTFTMTAVAPGALSAGQSTYVIDAIPTTLTAAAQPTPVDAPVEITITVASQLGTPSGSVVITDESGSQLGTAMLDSSGAATITATGLARGTHTLTATYAAQGSFGASSSAATTLVVTSDSGSLSGGGCSTTGGGSTSFLFGIALVVGIVLRRRAVAAAVVLASAGVASADEAGHSLDRFQAASADSAWFAVDSASFKGDKVVSLSFVGDYANQPLTVYTENGTVRQRVVTDSFIMQLGGSLTLADSIRISANLPIAPWQDGNGGTYNGMTLAHPGGGFGDAGIAGDVRVIGEPGSMARLAFGARVTLPTGSTANYLGDGVWAVEPRAQFAGSFGEFEYAAGASALLRSQSEMAGAMFGSELRFQAGAGMKLADNRVLIGPELVGAAPLEAHTSVGTPLELQFGVHYAAARDMRLGVGGGVGLINAVGEPAWRMLLSFGWSK